MKNLWFLRQVISGRWMLFWRSLIAACARELRRTVLFQGQVKKHFQWYPFTWIMDQHRKESPKRTISYCWWLKLCTTWDVWNPINNGKNYQPQLVTNNGISAINRITSPACNSPPNSGLGFVVPLHFGPDPGGRPSLHDFMILANLILSWHLMIP